MYENGIGVLRSFPLAYMWMEIASSSSEMSSKLMRDLIIKKMSKSEIIEGKDLVKKCKKKNYRGC